MTAGVLGVDLGVSRVTRQQDMLVALSCAAVWSQACWMCRQRILNSAGANKGMAKEYTLKKRKAACKQTTPYRPTKGIR